MRRIVFLLSLLFVFACKSKAVVAEQTAVASNQSGENAQKEEVEKTDEQIYHLLISFFSIGSGIDYERKKEMDRYFGQLESEKVDFLIEKVGWGREGEVDYCVDLSKVKEAEQKKIIEKVREIAKKSSWIDVQLDKTCRFKTIR